MILSRLFNKKRSAAAAANTHSIEPDAEWLSAAEIALGLVHKLNDAGHQAYLVGGCVRDLLMQHPPKDFDIATNATPQEICKLLPKARIVGRRFPIVLARAYSASGARENVEITTFRAPVSGTKRQRHGLITRDNKFGSMQDDANRRDLTINALYFDPRNNEIIDYAGGVADSERRVARILGVPRERFREDPVRILRTIRFSTRLGLKIDPTTDAAMKKTVSLLTQVQAARMFDEFAKPLLQANSLQSWELFKHYGVLQHCLPQLAQLLNENEAAARLIKHTLTSTESYLASGKPANPALLYATLLWPLYQKRIEQNQGREEPLPSGKVARILLEEVAPCITIPGRFRDQLLDSWYLQPQLESRRQVERTLGHPNMPLALHLLEFRASVEQQLSDLPNWWGERRPHRTESRQRQTRHPQRRGRSKPRNRRT